MPHCQRGIGGHGAAQMRLKEKQAVAVLRGGVGHQGRFLWLQHLEAAGRLFHRHQKAGLFLAQERRNPHHIHDLLTIRAAAQAAHQPLSTAALDAGSGGENGFWHQGAVENQNCVLWLQLVITTVCAVLLQMPVNSSPPKRLSALAFNADPALLEPD